MHVQPVHDAAPGGVEPARALPAGRIGYDLNADHLLLHTIQSAEAYQALRETGQLVPGTTSSTTRPTPGTSPGRSHTVIQRRDECCPHQFYVMATHRVDQETWAREHWAGLICWASGIHSAHDVWGPSR